MHSLTFAFVRRTLFRFLCSSSLCTANCDAVSTCARGDQNDALCTPSNQPSFPPCARASPSSSLTALASSFPPPLLRAAQLKSMRVGRSVAVVVCPMHLAPIIQSREVEERTTSEQRSGGGGGGFKGEGALTPRCAIRDPETKMAYHRLCRWLHFDGRTTRTRARRGARCIACWSESGAFYAASSHCFSCCLLCSGRPTDRGRTDASALMET